MKSERRAKRDELWKAKLGFGGGERSPPQRRF